MHKSKQCGWIFVKNNTKNKIIFNNENNNKVVSQNVKNNQNNNNKANKKNKKNKENSKNKEIDKHFQFRFDLNNEIKEITEHDVQNKQNEQNEQNEHNEHDGHDELNNNCDNENNVNDENSEVNNNCDNEVIDKHNSNEFDVSEDLSCSDDSNSTHEKNSFKKILCYNIIYNGSCKYGDKCLYAHSLDDQNINKLRKEVYDILKSDSDLSNINLKEKCDLYKTMLEMTKYCKNCNNNMCKGGYNCKSGVYDKKYCICINDLNHGFCHNYNCNFIHLSKRGLKSYYDDKNKKKNHLINKSPEENNISLLNDEDQVNNIFYRLPENMNFNFNKTMSNENDSESDLDDNNNSEISDMDIIDRMNESTEDMSENNTDYKKYIEIVCNTSIFRKI